MDAIVSGEFYRVSAAPEGIPDFPEILLDIMKRPRKEREQDVNGKGIIVRVEHCEIDGDFIAGQICRKQMANIPPQAGPDGLIPMALAEGHGLGHLAAFRYHRPTRVILMQRNLQAASPNRLAAYVAAARPGAIFGFTPVLRQDALERFKDRKVRSFTVRYASPQNLDALDDAGLSTAQGARLLAQAFEGMDFTITVSAGRTKKSFLDRFKVKKEVETLLASGADIAKLVVSADPDDTGREINFLEEHLKCKADLDLPTNDTEANYLKRKNYLMHEFAVRMDYLNRHFGAVAANGNGG